MPSSLVYQLALTRAEAGQFDQALALFNGRFFPSEEGGVKSEQVLFEIQLMQAEAQAASGKCAEAEAFLRADHGGLAINGATARAYVRMAAIAKACGKTEESEQLLHKAAASKSGGDSAWAVRGENLLGTAGAGQQRRLEESLANAERQTATSAFTGWWWYNIGTMQAALDHDVEARAAFRQALLLPDSLMSHHLSRAALAEMGPSH